MKGTALFVCLSVWVLCISSALSQRGQPPEEDDKFRLYTLRDMSDFVKGAGEMWKAYREMREANFIGADQYFRAKGNHNAAKHGRGGLDAAYVISDARTRYNKFWWRHWEDRKKDAVADEWGRALKDPNKFRPEGLDPKY